MEQSLSRHKTTSQARAHSKVNKPFRDKRCDLYPKSKAGPIPALLLCGGIIFAALYPLNRDKYAETVEALARRRAASAQLGAEAAGPAGEGK